MKPKSMATMAIIVTGVMMLLLIVCIRGYVLDPENIMWMAGMSMLSMGLMLFLMIFALAYGRPTNAEKYEQMRRKRK